MNGHCVSIVLGFARSLVENGEHPLLAVSTKAQIDSEARCRVLSQAALRFGTEILIAVFNGKLTDD